MAFKYPDYLVETDWLADHLNDSGVRVVDCTAFNRPDGSGGERKQEQWKKEQTRPSSLRRHGRSRPRGGSG